MIKPNFSDLNIDLQSIRWGVGNNPAGLLLIGRIQLAEPDEKQLLKEKEECESAQQLYEKYFNVGQKFVPSGKTANKSVVAKITYINAEKQTVSWKQTNLTTVQKMAGYKPAAGKWTINSFFALIRSESIIFIEEP